MSVGWYPAGSSCLPSSRRWQELPRPLGSPARRLRYFPIQETLLREVANVHPAVAAVDQAIDLLESDDVEERLRVLLDTLNPIVIADEAHMRASLQVFLENSMTSRRDGSENPYLRSRRRMRWLDEVLRPLDDLPDERRERLRAALALTLGIDSIVIMKDVCELVGDEAIDVLRWAAITLLRGALNGDPSDSHVNNPSRRPLM